MFGEAAVSSTAGPNAAPAARLYPLTNPVSDAEPMDAAEKWHCASAAASYVTHSRGDAAEDCRGSLRTGVLALARGARLSRWPGRPDAGADRGATSPCHPYRRTRSAAHVLFAPGDARRASAGDSGTGRPSGPLDDAAVYASEPGGTTHARRHTPIMRIAYAAIDAASTAVGTEGHAYANFLGVRLIRSGGHLSKGEYDVLTDGRHREATSTSPVHR